MECIVYSIHRLRTVLPLVVIEGELYTYTNVGLSTLYWHCISVVHSKTTILICYLLDYQQVHENTNVSIILLGDKKEPTK